MVEELGSAGQTILVRVNDFETGLTWADLDAVVCTELYCVMLPKVTGPEDVKRARHDYRIPRSANTVSNTGTVLIYPVLETAQGMRQAYEVAIASPRVVHMGGLTGKDGDIARAIGFQWTPEGHEAFYYISKVLLDARAANIALSDGRPRMVGYPGPRRTTRRSGPDTKFRPHRNAADSSVARRHRQRSLYANQGEIAHWKELIAAVEQCEREGARW